MPYQADLYYFERRAAGDHPPLVLIHGAAGSHLSWPPQIRRLPGYTVLAVDLPGHGRSPGGKMISIREYEEGMCAWLDRLAIPGAILVGHSMGAAIALALALDNPRRVTGLVLLGAGASLRVNPGLLEMSSSPATFDQAIHLITNWSFGRASPPRLAELVERRMAGTAPGVLHGDLLACDGFDVRERLPEISSPALVVCGEEDRMTPLREARFLADQIRQATLCTLPGCGHMAMLEQPETVAQAISEWLARPGERPPSGPGNTS